MTFTVSDGNGGSVTLDPITITVENVNLAPDIPVLSGDAVDGSVTVPESGTTTFTVTGMDPDGGSVTVTASGVPEGATFNGSTFTWTPDYADAAGSPYTVTFTVSDGELTTTGSVTITVTDVDVQKPFISNLIAIPNPVPLNTAVSLSALIDDSTTGGSSIATVNYYIDGTLVGTNGPFPSQTEVTIPIGPYTTAGVHSISLTATDAAGNTNTSEESILLAVYDPSGGFVTGGGWITSPAGAYYSEPTLTGKATFGFVSKYQKGAKVPTGQTEFQFRTADLNFKSTSYEWLVVSGPRAQYKGIGTVNGSGEYGFLLTAIDGAITGGGGTDKFRIKIWDKATGAIIYDNELGTGDTSDPTTVISGGSIVIHKDK
jgi:hypothetical protein